MENGGQVLRFSLASVPEAQRYVAAREFYGRGLVNTDLIALTERAELELEVWLFPGLAVTFGKQSEFISQTLHDPSRGSDDLILLWGSSGGRLCHLGREAMSGGGPVLLSAADKIWCQTHIPAGNAAVRLSRASLLALLPEAEQLMMRHMPRDSEPFRLLRSYLRTIREQQIKSSPELGRAIANHITELVALTLMSDKDRAGLADGPAVKSARRESIKRWVLEHLADPDLSVSGAASAEQVSTRYVQRLFEAEGTTFSAFVLSQRLALAHSRLSNPLMFHKPISAIAYGCGFGDLSYFNRRFHAAYGVTPSDVRHGTAEDE